MGAGAGQWNRHLQRKARGDIRAFRAGGPHTFHWPPWHRARARHQPRPGEGDEGRAPRRERAWRRFLVHPYSPETPGQRGRIERIAEFLKLWRLRLRPDSMFLDPRALFMLVVLVGVTGWVLKGLMVTWHRLNKGGETSSSKFDDMENRLRKIEAATTSLLVDVTSIREKQRFMA